MINLFGRLDGFTILHDRIMSGGNLSVPVIAALIKSVPLHTPYVWEGVVTMPPKVLQCCEGGRESLLSDSLDR